MTSIFITLLALSDPVYGHFLEEIYVAHKDLVYSIAYNIMHNAEDAEELVQDVFLKTYFNIHLLEYKSKEDIIFWLKLCARHRAIDYLRKKKRRLQPISIPEHDDNELPAYEIPDFSAIPETLYIDQEQKKTILAKIRELPDEQRTAIIYRYYFDMHVKEIAEIMGKKDSVISAMLYRAKKTLQNELGDMMYE